MMNMFLKNALALCLNSTERFSRTTNRTVHESVFCKHFVVIVFHCRNRCRRCSAALIPIKRAQVRAKLLLLSPVSAPQTHYRRNQLFHSITLSGPAVAATLSSQFNGPLLCILANTEFDPHLFVVSFFSRYTSQIQQNVQLGDESLNMQV